MIEIISSPQNKKIKFLKSLQMRKSRKKEGKFIVEGPVVLKEVLPYKNPLEVYVGDGEVEKYQSLLLDLERRKIPVIQVESHLLKTILPTEEPQGIVGVFSTLQEDSKIPKIGPLLYLDGIRDPGNLGGIFRSANAFGVKKCYLSKDCVDIYNPKVIRSTMAALFRVPFEIVRDEKYFTEIKEEGFQILGLDVHGSEDFQWKEDKILFVVGNEHHGISNDVKKYIDKTIRIPMEEEVESLNVNVATSICLYEYYTINTLRRSYEK